MRGLQLAREQATSRGKKLECFSLCWNLVEGVVAVFAGATARSISLMAFGLDSFIEVVSGSALLWRLSVDSDEGSRECHEKIALRIVGVCFLVLSAYITIASVRNLVLQQAPEHSIWGIAVAAASLFVMPMLARAKRRIGAEMGSNAMDADAKQTDFCAYLSFVVLISLILNWLLGWWWADPVAGFVMVPIAREGYPALNAQPCSC